MTFELAEVAVTRNSFAAILDRIARLAMPPPVVVGRMPAKDLAVAAGKDGSLGKSRRVTSAALRQGSLSEHDSSHANQETWAAGEKMEKNPPRARRGGGRVLLQSWLLRAWIGLGLSPFGKCRLI
jgi:hypothetical protein